MTPHDSARASASAYPPAPLLTAEGRAALSAFDLDPALLHLNHGSDGAAPKASTAAQDRLRSQMRAAPIRWYSQQAEAVARARSDVAAWIRLPAERFAFVRSASAAASTVWRSVRIPPGSEILVTDHGYGAVTSGARRYARDTGCTVREVHVPLRADRDQILDCLGASLSAATRMIVIDEISSATAKRFPVAEICDWARAHDVISVVDGAHAPILLPDAAASTRADVWFGNLHKFACAPSGSAVIVPSREFAPRIEPLVDSWGTGLDFPDAFDHCATDDLTAWLTSSTAIAEVERLFGWDRVRIYASDLANYAEGIIRDALEDLSGAPCRPALTAATGQVGALRLISLPSGLVRDAGDTAVLRDALIDEAGSETAISWFRGTAFLRISTHAYTTADHFVEFVHRALPVFRRRLRHFTNT